MPTVVDAVERSTRLRAGRATGWPVTAWFSRLKPDPLKRLHLDLGAAGKQLTGRARTSVPQAGQVERARVDTEVRALADDVSEGLARPWADAVRRASVSRLPDLGDRLDGALAGTDLGVERIPAWAGAVRLLQWLLVAAALLGAVWLGALAVMGYLQVPQPGTPRLRGVPLPTALLVGGVLAGVLLAAVCRLLVSATAAAPGPGRRPAAARRGQRGRPRAGDRAGAGRAAGVHDGAHRAGRRAEVGGRSRAGRRPQGRPRARRAQVPAGERVRPSVACRRLGPIHRTETPGGTHERDRRDAAGLAGRGRDAARGRGGPGRPASGSRAPRGATSAAATAGWTATRSGTR